MSVLHAKTILRRDTMKEYKYIKNYHLKAGGGIEVSLKCPIKCNDNYFIEAFWVPIRHQIGQKLVLIMKNACEFTLWYNQLASPKNKQNLPTEEFAKFVQRDADDVLDKALLHIDRIMAYMYGDAVYNDEILTPFVDEASPIHCVEDAIITINGRLPMQEEYFIKQYWRPLVESYKTIYPGIQFEIHFSESGTKIEPTLAFRKRAAMATEHGIDIYNSIDANPILQRVVSDLADAVLQAAAEYYCNLR